MEKAIMIALHCSSIDYRVDIVNAMSNKFPLKTSQRDDGLCILSLFLLIERAKVQETKMRKKKKELIKQILAWIGASKNKKKSKIKNKKKKKKEKDLDIKKYIKIIFKFFLKFN